MCAVECVPSLDAHQPIPCLVTQVGFRRMSARTGSFSTCRERLHRLHSCTRCTQLLWTGYLCHMLLFISPSDGACSRQHLTKDLKPLAKADLEMVEFHDDSESVVLRVGKKEFFHSTHQDTFLQDITWVSKRTLVLDISWVCYDDR